MNSGVYIIRARKPGARLCLPVLSWHFAYVGETTSVPHRFAQHVQGDARYGIAAKSWSDREPYLWLVIPLPRWKWLLRGVETLAILAVWPAYNVAKNRWNPRRIPPYVATRQRVARDRGRHPANVRPVHLWAVAALFLLAALIYVRSL